MAASHGHCFSSAAAIIFATRLRPAFARIKEFGPSGVKLDAAPPTQLATPSTAATKVDFIAGIKQFISPEQLEPAVEKIKNELRAHTTDKDEHLEIMIHGVASLNIQLAHERTYRNIFGSQVNALVSMNVAGGASEDTLKQIYAQAAAQYVELYKTYSFDAWIAFLVTSGLASRIENHYQTTAYGRGFLKYAVDMHLFFPKPY